MVVDVGVPRPRGCLPTRPHRVHAREPLSRALIVAPDRRSASRPETTSAPYSLRHRGEPSAAAAIRATEVDRGMLAHEAADVGVEHEGTGAAAARS